jgi:hypothetical protein
MSITKTESAAKLGRGSNLRPAEASDNADNVEIATGVEPLSWTPSNTHRGVKLWASQRQTASHLRRSFGYISRSWCTLVARPVSYRLSSAALLGKSAVGLNKM